jgi:hypothetical protein
METRLEKLLNLLENGSTQSIKNITAKEIGEITKFHPNELPFILEKVFFNIN